MVTKRDSGHRITGTTFVFLAIVLLLPSLAPAWAAELPAKQILNSVVKLDADIPPSARTAPHLGTKREGHAVVIDSNGLALTIGYLILEATAVRLTGADGKPVPATIVAYDHNTGFGLLRALRPLGVKPIRLGDSSRAVANTPVLVAGHGGAMNAVPVRVVSRRDFAGYWEYLLEKAIFTSPPFPGFGGAALIDDRGQLIGIGSLVVGDAAAKNTYSPGNMFIPINALKPIMGDLISEGRSTGPHHPWIGVYTEEARGRLFVNRLAKEGPARAAGIREGDIIVSVDDQPVAGQMDFYRKLWIRGGPDVTVEITVLTAKSGIATYSVAATDRYKWLQFPRGN